MIVAEGMPLSGYCPLLFSQDSCNLLEQLADTASCMCVEGDGTCAQRSAADSKTCAHLFTFSPHLALPLSLCSRFIKLSGTLEAL